MPDCSPSKFVGSCIGFVYNFTIKFIVPAVATWEASSIVGLNTSETKDTWHTISLVMGVFSILKWGLESQPPCKGSDFLTAFFRGVRGQSQGEKAMQKKEAIASYNLLL